MAILTSQYLTGPQILQARQIEKGIVSINGGLQFTDFLQMIGGYDTTNSTKFWHSQDSSSVSVGVTTGQTVTGSGSATVFVTTTAATVGAFRAGDIIKTRLNKNAYVYNVVTTAGQDTHELHSVDGSALIFVAGDPLVFSNVAIAEGGAPRANVNYPVTTIFNLIQSLGESTGVTDIASFQKMEFTVDGKNLYFYENNVKATERLHRAISGMFLGGQISTSQFSDGTVATLTDSTGKPTQTSMGLDQAVGTYGGKYPVVSSGTYGLADVKAETALLLASKVTDKDLMCISGTMPRTYISDYLKNLGSAGVTSVRMNFDGKAADFEVEQFTYGGFTRNYRTIKTFDDQEMYPLAGADIARSMYLIPKGKLTTSTGQRPYLGARYFDPKAIGYNVEGKTLANMVFEAQTAYTGDRNTKYEYSSYQALDFAGAKQMIKTTF